MNKILVIPDAGIPEDIIIPEGELYGDPIEEDGVNNQSI